MRFNRLSKAGVFEAFFDILAGKSTAAHLIQMFDASIVPAHISAQVQRGSKAKRSGIRSA